MGAPKPALGYPSRTAAVLGLRQQGLSTGQIAQALGIENKTVSALELGSSRPRREPAPSTMLGRTVVIPIDVLNALGPHAARRCISVNALARLIISTVVDDGMIDAVLDDAEALADV
jgi:predicted transcriptional regulator